MSVESTSCAMLRQAGASVEKTEDYYFTMNYSAFHPRCVSVLEYLPCQLLLSSFLKMYGCLLRLERRKHTLMLLKSNKMKNSVMRVTPVEGLDEGSMAQILSKERK